MSRLQAVDEPLRPDTGGRGGQRGQLTMQLAQFDGTRHGGERPPGKQRRECLGKFGKAVGAERAGLGPGIAREPEFARSRDGAVVLVKHRGLAGQRPAKRCLDRGRRQPQVRARLGNPGPKQAHHVPGQGHVVGRLPGGRGHDEGEPGLAGQRAAGEPADSRDCGGRRAGVDDPGHPSDAGGIGGPGEQVADIHAAVPVAGHRIPPHEVKRRVGARNKAMPEKREQQDRAIARGVFDRRLDAGDDLPGRQCSSSSAFPFGRPASQQPRYGSRKISRRLVAISPSSASSSWLAHWLATTRTCRRGPVSGVIGARPSTRAPPSPGRRHPVSPGTW